MGCEYCELEQGRAQIIYEDEEVVAAIKDTAVHPGQVTVFSRQHFTILEMVPEALLQRCFVLANKVGIAIFESLEAQGTNVIISNGLSAGQKVPHFGIEIIPRREGDCLNLQWVPKEMREDDLEMTLNLLRSVEKQKTVEKAEPEKKEVKEVAGKENYMIKSLRRLP